MTQESDYPYPVHCYPEWYREATAPQRMQYIVSMILNKRYAEATIQNLADEMGVDRSKIQSWRFNGSVPIQYAIQLSKLSKGLFQWYEIAYPQFIDDEELKVKQEAVLEGGV